MLVLYCDESGISGRDFVLLLFYYMMPLSLYVGLAGQSLYMIIKSDQNGADAQNF